MTTVFARIVRGELPADIVYQDDLVTAFKDVAPVAPVHILIVPNQDIPTVNDLNDEDERLAGRLILAAKKIAQQQGIAESGYRIIINCNPEGGQEIYHLHLHLIGGGPLGPSLFGPIK
jgi:histidine triad (HIT) family protein